MARIGVYCAFAITIAIAFVLGRTASSSASCTTLECKQLLVANGYLSDGGQFAKCVSYGETHDPLVGGIFSTAGGGARNPYGGGQITRYEGEASTCTPLCTNPVPYPVECSRSGSRIYTGSIDRYKCVVDGGGS